MRDRESITANLAPVLVCTTVDTFCELDHLALNGENARLSIMRVTLKNPGVAAPDPRKSLNRNNINCPLGAVTHSETVGIAGQTREAQAVAHCMHEAPKQNPARSATSRRPDSEGVDGSRRQTEREAGGFALPLPDWKQ